MYNKAQRKWVLSHPEYWKEGVNAYVYDAVVRYKERTGKKGKEIAEELGISAARLSQILNDGEANFTLDTLIRIALVTSHYPVIEFKDQEAFLEAEERSYYDRARTDECNSQAQTVNKSHHRRPHIEDPEDKTGVPVPPSKVPHSNTTDYALAA